MNSNVRHFPKSPVSPSPRRHLHEKRLTRIALRAPDSLKELLDARARSRELTLSSHLLDLAVADLEKRRKSGRTLSDLAGELIRAGELARAGVETDAQRIWILRCITRFQIALLEAA